MVLFIHLFIIEVVLVNNIQISALQYYNCISVHSGVKFLVAETSTSILGFVTSGELTIRSLVFVSVK